MSPFPFTLALKIRRLVLVPVCSLLLLTTAGLAPLLALAQQGEHPVPDERVKIHSINLPDDLLIVGRDAVFEVEISNEGADLAEGWWVGLGEGRRPGPALRSGERTLVEFRKRFDHAGWKSLTARLDNGSEKTAEVYCFMNPDLNSRYDLSMEELRRYFGDPPNEYRLIFYSHEVKPDFVTDLRKYGVGGIMALFYKFLYDPQHKDRSQLQKRTEFANANGMRLWLADEFGYPSGMAGGRVVEENPDFEVRGLTRISTSGSGKGDVLIELPEELERAVGAVLYPVVEGEPDFQAGEAVAVSGRTIETSGRNGPWQLHVFGTMPRDHDVAAQSTMAQFGHTGRYIDLLNPAAVDRFIDLMYQAQADEIEDFSERIYGLYTLEPQLMQVHWVWNRDGDHAFVSWNAGIPGRFKEMHGYDLLPVLGAIFEGDRMEDKRTRMHFHQTVGQMLSETYARRLTEWAEENETFSSGHFLLNDHLSMHVACYGDLMKFVSELHIPGVDTGIPDPHEMDGWPYQQNKFFSSIAAWKDLDTVNTLLDPIIMGRGRMRMSPKVPVMRNISNRVFLNGSNQLHTYAPLNRREPNPNAAVPSAGAGYTEEDYRGLNEYIGRISVLLRGARNETKVALYYPIAMFQAEFKPSTQHWRKVVAEHEKRQHAFEGIEQTLVEFGTDYNIVHPEAVEAAVVEDGFLVIGAHRYRYLIMPQMEILPLSVVRQLERFQKGGGEVLWVDSTPARGAYQEEDKAVLRSIRNASPVKTELIGERLKEPYSPDFSLRFEDAAGEILVTRFRRLDRRIYFVVNTSGEPVSMTASSDASGLVEVFDPLSGEIWEQTLPLENKIAGYSSLLLVEKGKSHD